MQGGATTLLYHLIQVRQGEFKGRLLMWLFWRTYAQRPKIWVGKPDQERRGMSVNMDQNMMCRELGIEYKSQLSKALAELVELRLIHYDGGKQSGWLRHWEDWDPKACDRMAAAERASRDNAGAPAIVNRTPPETPLAERDGGDKYGDDFMTRQDMDELLDSDTHPVPEAVRDEAWRFVEYWQRVCNRRMHQDATGQDLSELVTWLSEYGFTARQLGSLVASKMLRRKPQKPWPYLQRVVVEQYQKQQAQQAAFRQAQAQAEIEVNANGDAHRTTTDGRHPGTASRGAGTDPFTAAAARTTARNARESESADVAS